VLGLIVFGLPTVTLLLFALPGRVRQVRQLSAAAVFLRGAGSQGRGPEDPDRRRLLAMRAAFSLPYSTLLRYSRDPLGDLAAGRDEGLIAAVLAEEGLRPAKPNASAEGGTTEP
jgi:hypothetical protein